MVKQFHIAKFFQALVAAGGQMSRTDLAVAVFNRNWAATQLDELLSAPTLAGLITESKTRIRKSGRLALRYILTPAGWLIARTWTLPIKADRIAPEEIQRQFGLLVTDGNPWAEALERDAKERRAWLTEQKRLREEKAAAAEAKRKAAKAQRVQRPSVGRNRSPKEIADRQAWFSGMTRGREATDREAQTRRVLSPAAPMHPAFPLTMPPRQTQPTQYDTPHLDGQTLALIRKISAAGYQHGLGSDGKVLYNNKERLSPQEWVKRMGPGIID